MDTPGFTAASAPTLLRGGVAALALCFGVSACNTTLAPPASQIPSTELANADQMSKSGTDCVWPCQGQSYATLLDYVAATSPEVLSAQADRRASAAELEAASRAFGPSAQLQGRNGAGDDGPEQGQLVFSVRQPVWQGGVLKAERARAEAELTRQDATLSRTALDIKLAFNRAYADWRAAQEVAVAWNTALEQVERLLPRLKRSREAGALSQSDFRQVSLAADQVLSEQLAAQGAVEQARAELTSYLPDGVTENSIGQAKGGYGGVATGVAEPKLARDIIASLAPVREADANVRVAALSQEILKLARAPVVDLVAEAAYEEGEAGASDTEDAGVYLSVTSQFGAPGETKARLKGAEAAEEAARARRAATLRETRRRIAQSQEVMRDAAARVGKLAAAIIRASEALEAEQRSFEGLQSNGAQLVSAIDRLASLKQKRADARGAYWGARWTLQLYQDAALPSRK